MEMIRDRELEDGVAEELQSLVVWALESLFRGMGRVRKSLA
jgi:hypothetical protein